MILNIPAFDLTDPHASVEAMPYIMGHQPDGPNAKILYVVCDAKQQIPLSSRRATLPLADQDEAVSVLTHETLEELSEQEVESGGVLIYLCTGQVAKNGGNAAMRQYRGLADALAASAERHGLTVLDVLCVSPSHWWSYRSPNPAYREEGMPVSGPLQPGALTMRAIAHGVHVPPSEAAILAAVAPASAVDSTTCSLALVTAAQQRAARSRKAGTGAEFHRLCGVIDRLLCNGGDGTPLNLTPVEAAELLLGLRDKKLRDRGAEYTEPQELKRARELWSLLARHCAANRTVLAAAPITLAAIAAAVAGEVAVCRVLLDRALEVDPDYVLAELLQEAIRRGLGIDPLLQSIRKERRSRNG
ncbi:DUF4192 family protein [Kitasatospora sp. NA04385]|uniref:DUF4192 family protein n=1 Tax=Kitasatospora sp. NA04385 TaxID=2742135 RepID=UPI001590E1C3|nr:DUF4192 family protein [Kitasatospora sp. NA04385]QKW22329.1 DUF4192 family protein [Kitasatospora sp. NA04385]